jgi:hypothetical protein
MDCEDFVIRANIARYKALLETEEDERERDMLRLLIAEFEAKAQKLAIGLAANQNGRWH